MILVKIFYNLKEFNIFQLKEIHIIYILNNEFLKKVKYKL